MRLSFLPKAILITTLFVSPVMAADPGVGEWKTFGNGPSHSGYYPKTIGAASFEAGWNKTLGASINQVAVSGNTIYGTSRVGEYAFALSTLDGQLRWSFPLADAFSVNPPTYEGGRVYFQRVNGSNDSHLWCLDSTNGHLQWASTYSSQATRHTAPTVADGGVFINGGTFGGMYGFDTSTGVQRFFVSRSQADEWSPTVVDGVVYSCVRGVLIAASPTSGSQLWSRDLKTTSTGTSTSWSTGDVVVIRDGRAAVVGGTRLVLVDLVTRNQLWSLPGNYRGTPAMANSVVYAILGSEVKAYDAATGALLNTYIGSGTLTGQPIVTNDVLMTSNGTNTFIFNLGNGTPRQTIAIGGSLSYAAGTLYIASNNTSTSQYVLSTFNVVPTELDPPVGNITPSPGSQPQPNPDRPLGTTSVAWLDSAKAGEISYFLFDSPAKIERYSLSENTWLSPISLPDGPKSFAVDEDGIYVSFGTNISAFTLDGKTERPLLVVPDSVATILVHNGRLYLGSADGAKFIVVDAATGTTLGAKSNYNKQTGFSLAPAKNFYFARSTGVSPPDIYKTTLEASGEPGTQLDSPHHGVYPTASKTFVFPNGGRVLDNSGTIYSTEDLRYLGSIGGTFDDAAFANEAPVILRGNTLVGYSTALTQSGQVVLSATATRIHIADGYVYSFARLTGRGVVETKTPLSSLIPPDVGGAIDPATLNYTPDAIEFGKDGIVYLLNKLHLSIFRYSIPEARYLPSISLLEAPKFMAYSEKSDRLYLAYQAKRITRIDRGGTERAFAIVQEEPTGFATAGEHVFVVVGNNSSGKHYVYSSTGALLMARGTTTLLSQGYTWNEANRKLYLIRDSSPKNLYSESIDLEGVISEIFDSPYQGATFTHPIRVAPDGSQVVIGNGDLFHGLSLTRQGNLSRSLKDAAWQGGDLYTLSETFVGSNDGTLEAWDENRAVTRSVPSNGKPLRMVALEDGFLVVTLFNQRPFFSKYTLALDYLNDPPDTNPQPHPNPERELGVAGTEWIATTTYDDIAYFLFDEPAKIERLSLSTGEWLTPISIEVQPQAFTVGADGIFVGYEADIFLYSLDGTTETYLAQMNSVVGWLFNDSGRIYSVSPDGVKFSVFDTITGGLLDSRLFEGGGTGFQFGSGAKTIYSRRATLDGEKLVQTTLNDNGTFDAQEEVPYGGVNPEASQLFVFPDESRLADEEGNVYGLPLLDSTGSLGGVLDDLSFAGETPVVQRGNILQRLTPGLVEIAQTTLADAPSKIYATAQYIYAFRHEAGRGVTYVRVPVNLLTEPQPVGAGDARGTYVGVIQSGDSVGGQVGMIQVKLTSNGRFTGILKYMGKRWGFSGRVNGSGFATVNVRGLTLQFLRQPTGEFILSGAWQSDSGNYAFTAAKIWTPTRDEICPATGQYTVALMTDSDDSSHELPPFVGSGFVFVKSDGTARILADTVDGRVASTSGMLTEDGTWIIHLPTFRGQGMLSGQITFGDLPESDCTAALRWVKPLLKKARRYPLDFDVEISLLGSRYDKTLPALVVTTDSPNATFTADGGDITSPITDAVDFGAGNNVQFITNNLRAWARIFKSTGRVTGQIRHPRSRVLVPFLGVVLQKQNRAIGTFPGLIEHGIFELLPNESQ